MAQLGRGGHSWGQGQARLDMDAGDMLHATHTHSRVCEQGQLCAGMDMSTVTGPAVGPGNALDGGIMLHWRPRAA